MHGSQDIHFKLADHIHVQTVSKLVGEILTDMDIYTLGVKHTSLELANMKCIHCTCT